MRSKALTNMSTKVDKQAADILLYTQRCTEAIKKIPAPEGIAVFVTTRSSSKKPDKAIMRAKEVLSEVSKELDKADASADRASRKKNRAKTK